MWLFELCEMFDLSRMTAQTTIYLVDCFFEELYVAGEEKEADLQEIDAKRNSRMRMSIGICLMIAAEIHNEDKAVISKVYQIAFRSVPKKSRREVVSSCADPIVSVSYL